ncbi:hypothetical protein BC827DRAFT_1266640 [Russula dissimulans]|nr:hypothetical protein BC827DRAFT_1266640 [Russula dissimulans]
MSQLLDSGRYNIYSHSRKKQVGLLIRGPFKLPIRVLPDGFNEVWDVEHLEGKRYLLTINNFVTKAEGDKLWAHDHNVFPQVKGTKWIIEEKDDAGHYAITDHEGKGWTLKDNEDIVTLEHVPDTGVPDNQLWFFNHVDGLE